MQSASGTFATTVVGQSMFVDATVTVALPAAAAAFNDLTPGVESIKIDEALTTDAPAGTRAATGRAAASADIVLASPELCALLNPYNAASPLYRKTVESLPVVIRYGIEGETLIKFTGIVQSYEVDMAGGTVTLSCVDNRGTARGRIALPSFQAKRTTSSAVVGSPGLAATYVADQLMRSAGYHSCPPPRSKTLVYASMHGSAFPEYIAGNGGARIADRAGGAWSARETMDMVPGRWGTTVVPNSLLSIGLKESGRYLWAQGASNTQCAYISFWINVGYPTGSDTEVAWYSVSGPLEFVQMRVMQNGTAIRVQMRGGRPGPGTYVDRTVSATPTTINGWVHVAARFFYYAASPNDQQEQAWVNGVAGTPGSRTVGPVSTSSTGEIESCGGISYYPVEVLQIGCDITAGPDGDIVFTPTAYLEATPETLTVVPGFPPGTDPFEALQQFADAMQGVVRFDELGALRFVARKSLRGGAVARAVTSEASLKKLTTTVDGAAKYNRVTLPLTQWADDLSGYGWSAGAPISLLPGETKVIRVVSDTPLVVYPVVGMAVNLTGIPNTFTGDFRMSTTEDGIASAIAPDSTSLTVRVKIKSPSEMDVTVTSNVGVKVWLVAPAGDPIYTQAGEPVLRLPGVGLVSVSTPDSIEAVRGAGDRLLALPANVFTQNSTAAYRVEDVLGDTYRPRPMWGGTSIVPDARLQLGDRIAVTDPEANGLVAEEAAVVGMTHSLSAGDWEQELDLRTASFPGGWILSRAGRGEIGTTDYI